MSTLQVSPYSISFPDEDEDEWDTTKGIRVMAIAYVPDYSQSAFACIAAPDGDITDYLRLPHLLKRKNSFRNEEKLLKVVAVADEGTERTNSGTRYYLVNFRRRTCWPCATLSRPRSRTLFASAANRARRS